MRALAALLFIPLALCSGATASVDALDAGAAPAATRHATSVVFGTFEAPPFAMRAANGALEGYLQDYLKTLEARSALRFEVRFHDSLEELKQAVNAGSVDVAGPLVQAPEPPLEARFTRALEHLPMVIVTGPASPWYPSDARELAGRSVAGLRAGFVDRFLRSEPTIRYVGFETHLDALQALAFGQVEFAALEANRAAHYIERYGLSRLHLAGRMPFSYEPALAVSARRGALFEALTGAMAAVPASERAAIRDRWLEPDATPWYRRQAALATLAASFLLLLVSVAYAARFWRKARERGQRLQRKSARLARSERMYRALATSISDIVTLHAADGTILYASPSTRGLTGYEPGSLLGQDFVRLVHPDDQARAAAAGQRLSAAVEQRATLRIRCADGQYRFFESFAKVFEGGRHGEFVVVSRDVTERIRVHKELEESRRRYRHLAYHDLRTGLPNRAGLVARMHEVLAEARSGTRRLVVFFLDVDNLKTINDAHGYAAGDDLVAGLVARLQSATEGLCELARLGGDELVALVPQDDPQHIDALAAQMIQTCAQPTVLRGALAYLTISIGVARYPQDGRDAETLLGAAGIALRAAKAAGKNTWRDFSPELGRSASSQASSLQNLRSAFERGEFTLHYQPKFALASGAITGCEALLRWRTPAGLQETGPLIAAAEQSGFIAVLGEWVVRQAAGQSLAWRRNGLACPIAVNVSAVQLQDPRFVALLRELIVQDPELPKYLQLELTETALAQEVERARLSLAQFEALGFELHIDDFGTGYSSLARLSRLPVSTLKIDRSFVAGTPAQADSCEIVKALVGLAHALGLQTVAEGVETPAQRAFLQACGCDQGQGFLLARPMPAGDLFEQWGGRAPNEGRAAAVLAEPSLEPVGQTPG